MDLQGQANEMVVIHRILRSELSIVAELIRTAGRDTKRAREVGEHVDFLLTELHNHHTSEDELLWPMLFARAAPSGASIKRMEEQHEQVATGAGEVRRLLVEWTEQPTIAGADALAGAVDRLREALSVHLDEEEADIVPLIEQHVTPEEWAAFGRRSTEKFPREVMPLLLGQMLEVATPAEAALFFGKLPLVPRLHWHLVGRRQYRRYVHRVRHGAPARQPSAVVRWLVRVLSEAHASIYRRSDGRRGASARGTPLLLLTTVGRRSGRAWTRPLGYCRDGERLVVTGSNGGTDYGPAWALNLRANPAAFVQLGDVTSQVAAVEADGPEWDRLWSLFTSEYPVYTKYRTKTDRRIPIFVLEPATARPERGKGHTTAPTDPVVRA